EISSKGFYEDDETVKLQPSITATRPLSGNAIDLYENRLRLIREQFSKRSTLACHVMDPDIDPKTLGLFLIYFNAFGVAVTRPVEGWIHRSGRRCEEFGFKRLGDALCSHARREGGRHLKMIKDTHRLVKHWNMRNSPELDADKLLASPVSEGVQNYVNMCEEIITGDSPFLHLAVEYEMERLSIGFGPELLAHCERKLGREIPEALTYIRERASFDYNTTIFNPL